MQTKFDNPPTGSIDVAFEMAPARTHVPAQNDDGGIVASSVYANGQHIADIPIEEAGAWAKKPGHVVWIGLLELGEELLRRVQE